MIHHDVNHSFIFDHPELVEALIKTLIKEPWVSTLAWETLKKEDTNFQGETIDGELVRKRADRLWSVYRNDGHLCLFIFLEFQSTVAKLMAARLLLYIALGYDILIRSGRAKGDKPLPAVIPIVLYSGPGVWTAPRHLRELINIEEGHPLWRWQPSLEYPVVAERIIGRRCLESEGEDTLLKLIFALDSLRHPDELRILLPRLSATLKGASPELTRSTLTWLKNCAASLFSDETLDKSVGDSMKSNLYYTVQRWEREFLEQGKEEGLLAGLRLSLESLVTARLGESAWLVLAPKVSEMEEAGALRSLIVEAAKAETVGELI